MISMISTLYVKRGNTITYLQYYDNHLLEVTPHEINLKIFISYVIAYRRDYSAERNVTII